MLRIKKITEVIGKYVYTSEGDFFGQIEEVNLVDNKIEGWKIRVGSSFLSMFGGARGVVIPHQFVKTIGEIMIVNRGSLPMHQEQEIDCIGVDHSLDLGSADTDRLHQLSGTLHGSIQIFHLSAYPCCRLHRCCHSYP